MHLAILLAALAAAPAAADQGAARPPVPLAEDALLASLVGEALESRPELRQARSRLEAERERVPQAGSFPDPTLSLGIQNDGFRELQIGKMGTSFWQVMASQSFPWFGKRGLRADVATLQARQAEADLARARLSVEAEMRRAYLDLVLVRDQLALLSKLETLWLQSEGLARVRYEAGEGAQSDLLRAQLERSRLRQRRWLLEAEERVRLQALNRARVHPLDEPLPTRLGLADLADPRVPGLAEAQADAEARSPELARARLAAEEGERRADLARRDYFPDVTLSAGYMGRGSLEPMWQAGLSFTLPVFAGSKQSRSVSEREARAAAEAQGAETVRQVLRLRVQERLSLLGAVNETNRLYRGGVLVQSVATAASTMAQYRVGRVTFASVLEALAGYLADVDGFLRSAAAAQRIAIAQAEVSLDPVAGALAPGMEGGAMPGAGGMAAPAAPGPGASAGEAGGAPSMSRM